MRRARSWTQTNDRKLACDHNSPCQRCSERGEAARCTYRERPFKRRRLSNTHQNGHHSPTANVAIATPPLSSRKFPNPGYLGASAYTTIFGRLASDEQHGSNNNSPYELETVQTALESTVDAVQIFHGSRLIEQICNSLPVVQCCELVRSRVDKGVNLALAGIFIVRCAESAAEAMDSVSSSTEGAFAELSTTLFTNSSRGLDVSEDDRVQTFTDKFCDRSHVRWETLGLFFTAISRATIDLTAFGNLYSTEKERFHLRKLAMYFSDCCLEIALSLDCLNDLQLVLQYENFISHASVDGDQSKYIASFPLSSS